MARNHILNTLLSCCLVCLAPVMVQASEHHGVVKFAGLPVPGATVTATMGDKKLVAVTGPDGVYSFPDLADGVWNLQVEMLCFSPLKMEVAVAPNAPSPEWELKLLPFDEIKAAAPPPAPKAAQPAATAPAATAQADGAQSAGPTPSLIAAQAAPKKGSKAAKAAAAAAATATANARPGFQRADLNASGTPAGRRGPARTRWRR